MISAQSNGSGAGGNVRLNAPQSVQLIGTATNSNSLFAFPSSLLTQTLSTGKGGDLAINTNQLIVREGLLSASTYGEGKAGNINISTERLLAQNASAIKADTFGTGDAGNITIETGTMNVIDSQVGSTVFGKGFAGNLTIRAAESVEVSGKVKSSPNIENPAGLFAQVNTTGEGRGGNLTIDTKRL
ncbi:MAG: hypothetical protein ACYT04_65645, partial [Nostoc sp.]